MKRFFILSVLLELYFSSMGQKIHTLLEGNEPDSSFYHISKISDNEFWVAGKNGVFSVIDSSGNLTRFNLPLNGVNILKIISTKQYVYLASDNAAIFRYHKLSKELVKKEFMEFSGRCFYDLIALENGELIVCGGKTGIAKGEKLIPKGFIGSVDFEKGKIDVIWKSWRKFAWSLYEREPNKLQAATFNGKNSKIIQTSDFVGWKTNSRVKGLIHEIRNLNNRELYCGSKNIKYRKHGVFGSYSEKNKQITLENYGCLWSMDSHENEILAVTQSGDLIRLYTNNQGFSSIKLKNGFAMYDIEKISAGKYLVVGQGKSAFIVDF